MPTYYVDPSASGSDNGTDWTNAWTTIQRAVDGTNGTQPVAGDVIYCRGTEQPTAVTDFDGNSGTTAGGFIHWIGCNGSGTEDGTKYVVDMTNATSTHGFNMTSDYQWFDNFEIKNADNDGVYQVAGSDYHVWVNCKSHSNGSSGWNGQGDDQVFVRCQAYNNGSSGFYTYYRNAFILCTAYGNTDHGIYGSTYSQIVYCVSHNNGGAGDRGIYCASTSYIGNCVCDGNGYYGLAVGSDNARLFFNRVTNNSFEAVDFSDEVTVAGWNVFTGNSTEPTWDRLGNIEFPVYLNGSNTNQTDPDGADTDGYSDQASDDFNLTSGKTYNGDGNDTIDLLIGS